MKKRVYVDILILGNNRAGLTAAIYCSRANMKTVILDKDNSYNYINKDEGNTPNFISVTVEKDLSSITSKAQAFGAETIIFDCVEKMFFTNDTKYIETNDAMYFAKAVIITAGNDYEKFDIGNEQKFKGKGIYYNVISNIDKLKDAYVAVIGDGHNALDEALYLAKIAKKVIMIKRDQSMECKKNLLKEIETSRNIKIVTGYEIIDAFGYEHLEGVYLKEIQSGKQKKLKVNAIIGAFGKRPNIYDKYVHLEHKYDGYIDVDGDMMTNIKGVFASGAAIDKVIKEIPTDINNSTVAALSALRYVREKTVDNLS